MHGAEKIFNEEQNEEFCECLNETCGSGIEVVFASFAAYFATAHQRAEAFLMTLLP